MKENPAAQNRRADSEEDASADEDAESRGQRSRRGERRANPESAKKSALSKIKKAVGGELGGQTPSIAA